jgi:hypothetical protein
MPFEKITTGPRLFELVQAVSAPLAGEMADWPDHIQEKVMSALDRLAEREKVALAIVYSVCDRDYAHMDPAKDTWYVRVVASEVVAKWQ